ncbi:MAG: phosphatase PAP2 family protein [Candidatus Paceibacterales bacterium]
MLMKFFYKLSRNIADCYSGWNLLWQVVMIVLTFVSVNTGFDWLYYEWTRNATLQLFMFPAVFLGFLVPVFLPIVMYLYGALTKNRRTLNAAWAAVQAGILGLGISSLYKVFTGRVGPHFLNNVLIKMDTSHMFRFGFLRGGAFQGWPSSHTSVAFAMSMALVMLYPEKKVLKYILVIYALYIGLGVSGTIHWFSDFASGAILGAIIGITVGKSFLEKYEKNNS